MKAQRTYTQSEAAAYMGVTRQAVRARFLSAVRPSVGSWRDLDGSWTIPHADLVRWQKERQARARKLLATPTEDA